MPRAGFIRGSLPLRALLLLCLLRFGLVALPAAAQAGAPQKAAALSDFTGEPAGYRELIQEALAEYETRHFEEARALFRRAHGLFPNARTLRGQGMAEFELRNYAAAIPCLESALSSRERPLEGSLRTETEQLLERARRFVSRVHLNVRPAGATVLVDGVLMRVEPGDVLLLSMGTHSVEIRADAHQAAQRTLSVEGGEEQVLEVALVRTGALPRTAGLSPSRYRVSLGPQLSGLAPLYGYAEKTPGAGLDLSVWVRTESWAIDTRLGVRFDVTEENRDYFHMPLEVAAYRLLPIADHALWLGVGTGVAYIHERIARSQTTGLFAVTRVYTADSVDKAGVPLFARLGMLFFRSESTSWLTSVDYGVTFVELKHSNNEQAVRFQVGALFGRSP